MIRRAVACAALAIVAAVTVACVQQQPDIRMTCGTLDVPPIAVDNAMCSNEIPGHRWYSGRADDLDEPDEAVVIGEPLDEDWWNPAAQADLDDSHYIAPATPAGPRRTTAPVRPGLATPPPVAPTSAASAPKSAPKSSSPTSTRRR